MSMVSRIISILIVVYIIFKDQIDLKILHLPTLLFVISLTTAVTFTVYSLKHVKFTFFHLTIQRDKIPDNELENQRDFYFFAANTALGVGVFSQIMSLMHGLNFLSDSMSLGVSVAYSMTGVVYGIIISQFILVPMAKSLEINQNIGKKNLPNLTILFMAMLIPFSLIAYVFFIILPTFSFK